MKIVGITTCIGLRNILKCLGLELGFRGPANIWIGIGKEVIYTKYLGLDLGLEFLMPIIRRLGLSLIRQIDTASHSSNQIEKMHRAIFPD